MITSVAVTCDNRYIISGSSDKSFKVFDLQTKQQVHHFENAHQGKYPLLRQDLFLILCLDAVRSVAVTSNNKFIVSGSADKSIKVYNIETQQLIHHFENVHQGKYIK